MFHSNGDRHKRTRSACTLVGYSRQSQAKQNQIDIHSAENEKDIINNVEAENIIESTDENITKNKDETEA
jgi:hypothetical protein